MIRMNFVEGTIRTNFLTNNYPILRNNYNNGITPK